MRINILETELDAIGMVKQLKQCYSYCDQRYTLLELKKFVRFDNSRNIFDSIVITTKTGIPVKIIIVRNRNKKSECLYLLSTDCNLHDEDTAYVKNKVTNWMNSRAAFIQALFKDICWKS